MFTIRLFPFSSLTALSFILLVSQAQAQSADPAPRTAFLLTQHSIWIPTGGDSVFASSADSGLVIMPTPGAGPAGTDLVQFTLGSVQGGGHTSGQLARATPDGPLTLTVNGPLADMLVNNAGTVFFDLPAWLAPLPLQPDDSWADTVAYTFIVPGAEETDYTGATLPDTAWVLRIRTGRLDNAGAATAETWLDLRITSRPDYVDDPEEPRRVDRVTGRLVEKFRYDPLTGRFDSMVAIGRLAVVSEHYHATGTMDSSGGTLLVVRRGEWAPDPAAQHEARSRAFIRHGRDTTSTAAAPPPPHWHHVLRMEQGDTTAFLELLQLRGQARSVEEREAIEWALYRGSRGTPSARRHYAGAWRRGDAWLTSQLVRQSAEPGIILDTLLARIYISAFGTRQDQRIHRGKYGPGVSDLLTTIRSVDSVTPAAGEAFAGAARASDDPQAAAVFLLAAYRADPPRYLARVRTDVDTSRTQGREVRAYVEGDPNRPTWSSSGEERQKAPFPGFDAPLEAHLAYLDAAKLAGDRGTVRLRNGQSRDHPGMGAGTRPRGPWQVARPLPARHHAPGPSDLGDLAPHFQRHPALALAAPEGGGSR